MPTDDWQRPVSKITHSFDGSFSTYPALRKYAEAAAEFLDEDTDADFQATASWSVNGKSREVDPDGRSEAADEGPIRVSLRDDELGVGVRGHLRLKDIDGDSKYWVRRVWGKLLAARTAKLHQLVFNSDEGGEVK